MTTIKDIMVFNMGQIAVFDEKGNQIPELQMNLFLDWCNKADKLGYKIEGLTVRFMEVEAVIFKTSNGDYNIMRKE